MTIALDKVLLHVAAEQHVNVMQHAITEQHANAIQHAMAEPPAKPCSAGAAMASAPAPAPASAPAPVHAPPAPPPFVSTATPAPETPQHSIAQSPTAPKKASWRGQSRTIIIFRSPVQPKGPRRSIFEAHSRTGEGPHSWQNIALMHSRRSPGQEKRPFAARYRRHASKMSWLWQDMLPMYSKCPAKRR